MNLDLHYLNKISNEWTNQFDVLARAYDLSYKEKNNVPAESESFKIFLQMLNLQHNFNSMVNPKYMEAGNKWGRASMIEANELIDHYGWKWWKHQETDLNQSVLEVIDILHFVMSEYLELAHKQSWSREKVAYILDSIYKMNKNMGKQFNSREDVLVHMEMLAILARVSPKTAPFALFIISDYFHLDIKLMYKKYCEKNVLNVFRQDHGYNKPNTYLKSWKIKKNANALVEDNMVLSDIVEEMNSEEIDEHYFSKLYKALEDAYKVNFN